MRSAAMTNQYDHTNAFVVSMAHARYRGWRQQMETFKAVQGAREVLSHVPESVWAQKYAANDDAYTAVIDELTD